jgi:hypothetical protein
MKTINGKWIILLQFFIVFNTNTSDRSAAAPVAQAVLHGLARPTVKHKRHETNTIVEAAEH